MTDEWDLAEHDELVKLVDVPEEWAARIDAVLLAHTTKSFRKVARIVGLAMKAIPDAPETLTDSCYARRIMHLVESGQMESQGNLRRMRFSEVRLPSPPLPEAELRELVAQGDYWTLGCIYADGQGVARDYVKALKYHRVAAERGGVWSQFNVGRFYMEGYGVDQDYQQAYFWFRVAVNGSTDQRRIGYWLEQVAPKLDAAERASLDQRAAAWRPTIGFTE